MRDVVIVVLLFFGVLTWNYQPYMDVVNGARDQYLQTVAYTAISEAKIKGYFTDSDLANIQQTVATGIGYPVSDVIVSGTTTPAARGTPIDLNIAIPSTISLFTVSPSTNSVTLAVHETADSEALQQ